MTLDDIEEAISADRLTIFGALHHSAEHKVPDGIGTLVLLGPSEPGFWDMFSASPEYRDGAAEPLDRWSTRIITGHATRMNAQVFFPFGDPPTYSFIRWAHGSGRAHQSPVGLLVHDAAGLMVSYRGALGFAEVMDIPRTAEEPCLTCTTKPCLSVCPVDAFGKGFYDVPACKVDLDRAGNDCMARGCAVRRACPVSQHYGRIEAQSAFHMRAFK